MKITLPQSLVTRALLLAIATLALIIAAELLLAGADESAETAAIDAAEFSLPPPNDNRLISPQIVDFVDVLERPAFFQDRKLPLEPEPAPVTSVPLLPLRLTLEGVAISSDSRVAVLRNTGSNQLLQLAEGMSHDGWLLETVSADRALFTRGAEQTELLLDASN